MYAITRFLEFFLEPGNALVLLLAAGTALLLSPWRRAGTCVTVVSAGLLLLVMFLPIGYWILLPLENRYARPPWPKHVDGVLVLGGAFNPGVYLSRGVPSENVVEGRFVTGAELLRSYPNARLVFSGGSGDPGVPAEADAARLALDQLGVDQNRVIYENRSRTTWENLLYSQKLAKPGEVWLLATSASQLPRAMAVARRLNWKLVPWPSDYKTAAGDSPGFFINADLSYNLDTIDMALHEWIGIFVYWMTDRARLT